MSYLPFSLLSLLILSPLLSPALSFPKDKSSPGALHLKSSTGGLKGSEESRDSSSPSGYSICKILHRCYYNFNSIEEINKMLTHKLTDQSSLLFTLCRGLPKTDLQPLCSGDLGSFYRGNVILKTGDECKLIQRATKGTRGVGHGKRWRVQHVWRLEEYYNSSNSSVKIPVDNHHSRRHDSDLPGSAIIYSTNLEDPTLKAASLEELKFGLVCNPLKIEKEEFIYRKEVIGKTLWVFFEGSQACGFDLIEPAVFMKNHLAFPITFVLLSIVGIIMRRINERITMTIFGMQFGIFITLACLGDLELFFHFTSGTTIILYICSVCIGSIAALFCYMSRNSSIFILFLGAGISIGFTFLSFLSMVTSSGIDPTVFWLTIILTSCLCIALNVIPSFYDNYAHPYLTSVDFPFYLCMSSAVMLEIYPDMLTLNRAKALNIDLSPDGRNWLLLGTQLLLTVGLSVDGYLLTKAKALKLKKASQGRFGGSSRDSLDVSLV